jgi:hypothetical protein
MMKPAPLLLAALLVTGCATPSYVSPVEVTRFAAPQAVLGSGTIMVTPAPGTDGASPEYAAFAAVVRRQLEPLGYRVVAQCGAQVALLSLDQSVSAPEPRRGPVSVGGGASAGTYGSGVGVGIGLDLTPRAPEAVQTRLALAIRPAAGGSNLWEGRAEMSATPNSDYGTADTIAPRMVAALMQDFPGTSGETILVP